MRVALCIIGKAMVVQHYNFNFHCATSINWNVNIHMHKLYARERG